MMKSKLAKHALLSLLGIAFCTCGWIETAYAARRYQIEIIVFKPVATNTPTDSPLFSDMAIYTGPAIQLISEEASTDDTAPYTLLAKDKLSLNRTSHRLERDPQYQVLLHLGWQQSIQSEADRTPIHIYGGDLFNDTPQRLNFAVSPETMIPLSYIHDNFPLFNRFELDGNLWLSKTRNVRAHLALSLSALNGNDFVSDRLDQTRIIKGDKLYYFDHPKLGALLKITPMSEEINVGTT